MENAKKRPSPTKDPKFRKKAKIETAADAVKELDNIVLRPLSLPMKTEMGVADETSKIPRNFLDNHTKMFFSTTGYDVFMASGNDLDLKTPLKNDIRSLMASHDRWEMVARKLRDKCVELKREIAVLLEPSAQPW